MTNQVNGSFTIVRPGPVDDYTGTGPETTVATAVPGEFIEHSRKIWDPVTGTPRTVREVKVRVPFDTDVKAGDRLVDEDDPARIYPIREVHQPRAAGWSIDKSCTVQDLSNHDPA